MDREAKLSYLIDELGMIDDRYVNEVLITQANRRREGKRRMVALLAAALATLFLLTGALWIGKSVWDHIADEATPSAHETSLEERVLALDTSRFEKLETAADTRAALHDGTVRLIWTTGEEYCTITVSNQKDARKLRQYLSDDDEKTSVSDPPKTSLRMWVSLGDGSVLTPYLLTESGGAAYGMLPDYAIEAYPSSSFENFIVSLLQSM